MYSAFLTHKNCETSVRLPISAVVHYILHRARRGEMKSLDESIAARPLPIEGMIKDWLQHAVDACRDEQIVAMAAQGMQ